jgi:AmmeMemoRadiSam system protein A
MLTASESGALIDLARRTIERALRRKYPEAIQAAQRLDGLEPPTAGMAALDEPRGAFVTLHAHGDLRGCIGYVESALPLLRVVAEVAEKAAFEDPRFPPLTPDEYPDVEVEISVLSPLRQIASPEEIVVGTHGLLLEHGWHRGLLLPQVATEYGWDRTVFLENVARKAGLPATAWKAPSARIFLFTADIIHEQGE